MIIDALQCGYFTREVFQSLQRGQVGCVTNTLGFWEGAVASMDAIGRWRDLVDANSDIAGIALTAADITRISGEGRVAIVMGYQNTDHLEGRIRFIELFADMGVRVMQLTYNNQNSLGSSCYEAEDGGLARFGKEVVREMNRAGVLIDLSHVGNRTSLDAIRHSQKPVAITHANPDAVYPHKRNKTNDVLHALRDNGGVIGCAAYRNISGDEFCKTVDNWCGLVAQTVDIVGIDHVGIGTDKSHNTTQKDLDWMRSGMWTRGVDYGAGSAAQPGKALPPDWFREVHQLGDIIGGLSRVGFSDEEVTKITSGNWLRVYREAFGG